MSEDCRSLIMRVRSLEDRLANLESIALMLLGTIDPNNVSAQLSELEEISKQIGLPS